MKLKQIVISLAVFLVASCSIIPKSEQPVEVVRVAERPPIFHPPLPRELALVDVDFEILTPEIMEQYLKDIEEGNAPRKAYYALTSKEYENLSMNMAEFKRYLKNILAINKYYRDLDKDDEEEEEK